MNASRLRIHWMGSAGSSLRPRCGCGSFVPASVWLTTKNDVGGNAAIRRPTAAFTVICSPSKRHSYIAN